MTLSAALAMPNAPWVLYFEETSGAAYELAWRVSNVDGVVARVMRGKKMRTLSAFYNEVGAALQFPDYFGENGSGLEECLGDLSWIPAAVRVLVVCDAAEVLADEENDSLAGFADLLVRVATAWATPIANGSSWDRPAVPFHVVLQMTGLDLSSGVARWAQGGTRLSAFTK